MNKAVSEFMDEASPRQLLETYFDSKTRQKGSISAVPDELVESCIRNIAQAIEKLPIYGIDNKIVRREQYLEARAKSKKSGFKF